MRALLAGLLLASAAVAGGGPETTLLVVNADSPMSRLVANEYASLRDIPRTHVVLLEGVPLEGTVPLAFFRDRIWKPIDACLKEQGLEGQIDLVLYSVDFPFGVDIAGDGTQMVGHRAALTGLTFLIRRVEEDRSFTGLETNPYYGVEGPRPPTTEEKSLSMQAHTLLNAKRYAEAAQAFDAYLKTYPTHENGWYNYACCLAHLGKNEQALNALANAVDYGFLGFEHAAQDPDLAALRELPAFARSIERMKQGDGGGAYTAKSRAYRAGDGGFLSTQLGYTGRFGNSVPEVLAALRASIASDGTSPDGTVYFLANKDVRSTTRSPFWRATEAELRRRGRKAVRLDGVLPEGKEDVIGAVLGAAGFSWPSSKSRILPGAIVEHLTSFGADFSHGGQTKFSELVRFGAAGTSGTVTEPLAIPNKFPNPMIHAFYADGCSLAESFFLSVQGPYQLLVAGDGLARPFAKLEKVAVDAPPMPWSGTVEVGGGTELWVDGRRTEGLEIDTTKLDDGRHEVRVVKVTGDAVATRSYGKLDAIVNNRGRSVAIQGGSGGVTAKCAGAKSFRLMEGARVIATSPDGTFKAPALGLGPAEIYVVAEFDDGAARSAPLRFDVPPSPPAPPSSPDRPRKPGLGGTVDGQPAAFLNLDQIPNGKPFVLDGWFEAPRDGLYELSVTGKPVEALALAKGWHPLRIEGTAPVSVLLGGEQPLDAPRFEHATFDALPTPEAPKGLEALVDGKREGDGVAAPSDGLILSFKTSMKDVAAVTLFPGKGAFPTGWTVETTTGSKWLPAKDLCVVVARPASVAKDQPEVPAFVEISFAPVTAKKVRLKVKEAATLAEVEVLGLSKGRK
ncbi:MAG TPA: hypothetical protein VFY93_01270 [Planctomycetota bacterium]|nr:hypothetical protein [Planctomycetota bacterium]